MRHRKCDAEKAVSSHDLIFETAPEIWQNGFPIGNGHFGAMVYQPGNSIELAVSKLDVWDRRAEMPPKIPFSEIKRIIAEEPENLLDELSKEKRPAGMTTGPKPCGKLNISYDIGDIGVTVFDKTQVLNLYGAVCCGSYEVAAKQTGFSAFVSPYANLLVVRLEDLWIDEKLRESYIQDIRFSREIDRSLGTPVFSVEKGISYLRYRFPDNFEYTAAVLIDGIELEKQEVFPDSVNAVLRLKYGKKRRYSYRIYLAVATSMDSKNPMELAADTVKKAAEKGCCSIEKDHKKWWAGFWDKSSVFLDNKFLEALWYFSLYQFASSSRGDTAPGLFGLWNAGSKSPWFGDYHGNINMVMAYWHIFSSNHMELGEPFFKTFEKIAAIAKKQTMEVYQIDGLKFPMATLDTGVELCANYYRMMQCPTAFYGLVFWNWFLYTRDRRILKEKVFPILEEGSKFYLALTEEKDGKVLIGPSWAPEQGPVPAYNVNNDLGLIRPFWKAYADACDILGKKSPHREKVKYYLSRFPEYPQKDGEFIDSLTAGGFIGLNHPGLLAMVVPGNDVDAESPLAQVALKTLHNYLPKRTVRRSFADRISSACDLAWPWLLAAAVRLKDLKYAEHLLLDIGIGEFLKPNGMFAFIGGGVFRTREEKRRAYSQVGPPVPYVFPSMPVVPAGKHVMPHALFALSCSKKGREQTMSMLEHPSGFIYAVNEMLLQSYGGCIKLFPSIPGCMGKNCSFHKFLAEGGFEVSAAMENRKLLYVKIKSLRGERCRLKASRPVEKSPVFRTSSGKKIRPGKFSGDVYEWDTEKGMTYVWKPGKNAVRPWKAERPRVKTFVDVRGVTVTYGKKGHIYEE